MASATRSRDWRPCFARDCDEGRAGLTRETLPAEHNTGALALLAQAEFTAHEFTASRDHAERLIELEPGKGYPFEILGDALLELGDYEQAETAFRAFQQADAVQGLTRVAVEQRLSRLAFLHGDQDAAERHMLQALRIALTLPVPPREAVAWCRWQMGELAFNAGRYQWPSNTTGTR